MQISPTLILTLLLGAGVAHSAPADDTDLGFYVDDVPSESILRKRQRPSEGNFRGGGQTQAAAPAATNTGDQGGTRLVSQPLSPTAAVAANAGAGVSVTTIRSTLLADTITKTLMSKSSYGAQATGKSGTPTTSKLHARQMGMPWWQHRGIRWNEYANGAYSDSNNQQWSHGGSMKNSHGQGSSSSSGAGSGSDLGSGSGSGPGAGSGQAPNGQATQQSQPSSPQASPPQSSQAVAPAPSSGSSSSGTSSGGSGYMSVVSKWRSAMSKPALSQSSQLEANALKTVNDGKGQMVHELNPGSMAQVLAPGNANNFESVFVGGWLCERPTLPGLNGICSTEAQGWDHSNGETGHADILSSTSYSKIGCALADGIWACDLA